MDMHTRPDTREAVNRQARRATHDLYGPVHKGLRRSSTQLLCRLGNTDADDAPGLSALLDELEAQLALSAAHLMEEDRHIHPALESRAPRAALGLKAQHCRHEQAISGIRQAIEETRSATSKDRGRALHALYLRYSAFVGEDLAHMHEEETVIQPLLQTHFSDDELLEIEGQIVKAIAPQVLVNYLRIIVPAANPTERATMLAGMRAGAPAEAFQAIIRDVVRPSLSDTDWRDLSQRLAT